MKQIAGAFIIALLGMAPSAMAQTSVDQFELSIKAENETAQKALVNLATTFTMLSPRTSGLRKASRIEFMSGTGLITDNQPTEKLISGITPPLGDSVAQLTNMGTPCHVSRLRFTNLDVMLAVHDAAEADAQGVYRCFVAALWLYHTGDNETTNMDNWRLPYVRLLGSVSSGRPAFAGFGSEEN